LTDAVAEAIAALDRDERRLVEAAAVAGRPVPLAVAVVSITRLVFLQLTAGARIPFVDGWLIQLSILSLYIGPFIVYGFLNLIDVLPVK